MKKSIMGLVLLALCTTLSAQIVITDTIFPYNQYNASGYITKEGANSSGNMSTIAGMPYNEGSPTNCGFVVFDLSKLPPGTVVQNARIYLFIGSSSTAVDGPTAGFATANGIPGNPITGTKYTQQQLRSSPVYADALDWNTLNVAVPITSPINAAGIVAIQNRVGSAFSLGIAPPTNIRNTKDIRGYSHADKPGLVVEYTIEALKAPKSNFYAEDTNAHVSIPLDFYDQTGNYPATWLWHFGDGDSSLEQNPTHVYSDSGNYTVTLKTSNSGGTNTKTSTDYIRVDYPPAPKVQFIANDTLPVLDDYVYFTNLTVGYADSFYWDFGDGNTSTEANTEHLYSDTGLYSVQLIVKGPFESDTLLKHNYIHVGFEREKPISYFELEKTGTNTYQFYDYSDNTPVTWFWNFGDKSSSNERNPIHEYGDDDDYLVCLKTSNNYGMHEFCAPLSSFVSTSVRQERTLQSIVYPNPAQSILYVDLLETDLEATSFVITNLTGQVVLEGAFTKQSNSIDLVDLDAGVYFLQINTRFNSSITKIVKY